MLVYDRMSTPVVTLTISESFYNGLQLMQERKLRRLPVVTGDNRLVGIVTERDLTLAASRYLSESVEVEQVMERTVLTIAPETPITEAAILMMDRQIGGLPVIDAERRVLGIITESDIFRVFVDLMRQGATDDPNFVASKMLGRL